jgi:hypothetical protein
MTTQDQHTETEDSQEQTDSTTQAQEPSTTRAEPAMEQTQPFRPFTAPTDESTESSPERSLFTDDLLAGLRARWDDVQAGFVDDPRKCVEKADGLVADVVDKLTTGFSDARSRLEDQWARGEDPSTEDLRLALKRYRVFFERLLTV